MSSALGRYVRHHHLALLALFVALGGTAYAAVQLERNQVKSRHIGPGQVKKSDIAARAVNSAKVANRSLREVDFAVGQLPAGATGSQGPTGATGPAGNIDNGTKSGFDLLTVNSCGETMLRTLAISVSEPSRVLAIAQAHAQKTTTADNLPTLRIRVVDSTATDIGGVTFYTTPLTNQGPTYPLTAVGLVKGGSPLTPVTLAPGEYTIQLTGQNFGDCAGSVNYTWTSLDYVLLGSG